MEFKYGDIILPSPELAPPEAWPEWSTIADPVGICRREWVGGNPRGIRWSAWPLTFEQYVGDDEPNLADSAAGGLAYNRLVSWKRISRTDSPLRWRQGTKPWRIDGFHTLEQGDYTKKWHKNARRDLRLWEDLVRNKKYKIEEVPFADFKSAYKKSTAARKVGSHFLSMLERRLAYPASRERCKLWGVRNMQNGEVVAGTAAHYSPTFKSSVRECPFILPEAKHIYAATGLIGHWFEESQKQNIKLQVFTCFWHKGAPRGWKGASEFKSHFGLQYVAYPPLLTRIVRGRFL